MRRVVVIGTSGSGKTTLARDLAAHLQVQHIELDALNWNANWTPTPFEQMQQKVRAAIADAPDGWTVCGHYGQVREILWPQADTLIWLDYPLGFVIRRLIRRTFQRWWQRETLWNGNRERLWTQFCTSDSLFLYTLNSYRRRKYQYPRLIKQPQFAHLRVHHFRSAGELERWKTKSVSITAS